MQPYGAARPSGRPAAHSDNGDRRHRQRRDRADPAQLQNDDVIIVDGSDDALAAGVTSPDTLAARLIAGVIVWSLPDLHAKGERRGPARTWSGPLVQSAVVQRGVRGLSGHVGPDRRSPARTWSGTLVQTAVVQHGPGPARWSRAPWSSTIRSGRWSNHPDRRGPARTWSGTLVQTAVVQHGPGPARWSGPPWSSTDLVRHAGPDRRGPARTWSGTLVRTAVVQHGPGPARWSSAGLDRLELFRGWWPGPGRCPAV